MAESVRGRFDFGQCRGELAAVELRSERAIGKQANPVCKHGGRGRPVHPGAIRARHHGLQNGRAILDAGAACLVLNGGLPQGRLLRGQRVGALFPCCSDILLGLCRRRSPIGRGRFCRSDTRSGLGVALGGLQGAPGEPEHRSQQRAGSYRDASQDQRAHGLILTRHGRRHTGKTVIGCRLMPAEWRRCGGPSSPARSAHRRPVPAPADIRDGG